MCAAGCRVRSSHPRVNGPRSEQHATLGSPHLVFVEFSLLFFFFSLLILGFERRCASVRLVWDSVLDTVSLRCRLSARDRRQIARGLYGYSDRSDQIKVYSNRQTSLTRTLLTNLLIGEHWKLENIEIRFIYMSNALTFQRTSHGPDHSEEETWLRNKKRGMYPIRTPAVNKERIIKLTIK
jgi:hypothetical protein